MSFMANNRRPSIPHKKGRVLLSTAGSRAGVWPLAQSAAFPVNTRSPSPDGARALHWPIKLRDLQLPRQGALYIRPLGFVFVCFFRGKTKCNKRKRMRTTEKKRLRANTRRARASSLHASKEEGRKVGGLADSQFGTHRVEGGGEVQHRDGDHHRL